MRGEAEMGLDMYEGGIGPLGYVRVHMEKVLGMELPGIEREGCRGDYMDVNCEGL